MRDRNKNKITGAQDFLRYRGDKMSGKERNAFERELQRDPFAEEASEGLASITPEEALKDISSLERQLKQRTGRSHKTTILRLAASIAVLMIISSIFIIFERKSAPERIASNIERTESIDIIESVPVAELPEKKEPSAKAVITREKKAESPGVEQKNQEPLLLSEKSKSAANLKGDSMEQPDVEAADKFARSEKMAVIPPAPVRDKNPSSYTIEGKVLSSDDNKPIAGVAIVLKGEKNGVTTDAGGNFNIKLSDARSHTLVASYIGMGTKEVELKADTPVIITMDPDLASLNEMVVTAYGISREEAEIEADQKGYVPPKPSVGKSDFDKYIRENIQLPDTVSSGNKIVVVVSFSVLTDGSIDSIMIIRSPGKLFSEEAIRLIRSGPAWQPASENGKNIEDKVRLRIVFKQD